MRCLLLAVAVRAILARRLEAKLHSHTKNGEDAVWILTTVCA